MTDQELDRLMRHVLMDGVEQKSEQPSEADNGEAPAFQPSPRYQRQITAMKRDPWAWAKKKQRPAWKKYAQTAAALLLVAGLGLAASPTARADIVRLAVEWNQNRASFVYSGPDVGDELPCYVLGDLPEGYVQTDWQRLGPALVAADYESADGDYLYLDYSYMQQGGGTFIDMEEGEVIETLVNGMEGYFFQDADPEAFDILTWIDTRQNIQFTLGGCMDLDQALALADGLERLDTDP